MGRFYKSRGAAMSALNKRVNKEAARRKTASLTIAALKKQLKTNGQYINQVKGTGKRGAVVKADLVRTVQSHPNSKRSASSVKRLNALISKANFKAVNGGGSAGRSLANAQHDRLTALRDGRSYKPSARNSMHKIAASPAKNIAKQAAKRSWKSAAWGAAKFVGKRVLGPVGLAMAAGDVYAGLQWVRKNQNWLANIDKNIQTSNRKKLAARGLGSSMPTERKIAAAATTKRRKKAAAKPTRKRRTAAKKRTAKGFKAGHYRKGKSGKVWVKRHKIRKRSRRG